MPIFIGGMFKSGTSLLRRLIGSHPTIFAGLETNWFRLDPYFASNKLNAGLIDPIVKQWSQFNNLPIEVVTRIIRDSRSSEDSLNLLMSHLQMTLKLLKTCSSMVNQEKAVQHQNINLLLFQDSEPYPHGPQKQPT